MNVWASHRFSGAGAAADHADAVVPVAVTATLANVAADSLPLSWAVTASPATTLSTIGTVAVPTVAHVTPSADVLPVNVLPSRTIRSHTPALPATARLTLGVVCVAVRTCHATPFPGVSASSTNRLSARADSRTITPALAQEFVFCWAVTCATTVPLPTSGCDVKWNWSVMFQMSAPPPATVTVAPLTADDPARAGAPMSASAQAATVGGTTTGGVTSGTGTVIVTAAEASDVPTALAATTR